MTPKQLVARERSLGRIAGILGLAGILLILVPPIFGLGSDFNKLAQDAYADRMAQFELNRSDILLGQLVQAAGVLLFAAPMTFLLQAAAARSERVRRQMVGFTIAGPLLLAISLILYFAAYDSVASSFNDMTSVTPSAANDTAKNLLTGETTYSTFGALQIAGLITMVIAIIYTSLWAMRTGLLTRFLGFIGIALGVGFVLIGPFALAMWTILVSPLIARLWPGPRPPAWDAGVAIEWPSGPARGPAPPPPDEEKADPKEFGAGDGEDADDAADDDDDAEAPARPGRRDNRRKRKRKQRG